MRNILYSKKFVNSFKFFLTNIILDEVENLEERVTTNYPNERSLKQMAIINPKTGHLSIQLVRPLKSPRFIPLPVNFVYVTGKSTVAAFTLDTRINHETITNNCSTKPSPNLFPTPRNIIPSNPIISFHPIVFSSTSLKKKKKRKERELDARDVKLLVKAIRFHERREEKFVHRKNVKV